ncbi:lipoyl(octanoyl) transferase LipB [Blattabacterium cuenoti]|uniref:lipoyl(octanoyl) transferase LipB n=1 Tax=Blattabacterium cuenoti TaxID=1653831 RepID=UPI00163B8453|nr:lipoyl(octanoyl) transferase LipB [Blattabacterium cuenoti]
MRKKILLFKELNGLKYQDTWSYQKKIFDIMKQDNNILKKKYVGYLLFVKYNQHIYTIGKNGKENEHLLVNSEFMKKKNIDFYRIDRGGDITYHGPGQLVIYPILDLNYFFMDIHKYIRFLEEVIIKSLWIGFKINGVRDIGKTGIWISNKKKELKKICSIGIKVSRWVTMHGLAFNINTNLQYFKYIIPCGIYNRKMTSLKNELYNMNNNINENESLLFHKTKNIVKKFFKEIFEVELIQTN